MSEKPDAKKPPAYLETYQYFTDRLRSLTGWHQLRKDDEGDELSGRKKEHWIIHNGDIVDQLCDPFFTFDIAMSKHEGMATLCKMDETAARIIGYVAMGGPKGRDDWYELFRDIETRKAVVYAVLGLVMQEFVLSSLCYGADRDQIRELHRHVDLKFCDFPYEGFIRTRKRGKKIRELWGGKAGSKARQRMTSRFVEQSKELAWQTYELLAPILALHPDANKRPPQADNKAIGPREEQAALLRVLFALITRAGLLSLQMRLDRQTVYLLTPAHKDEHYAPHDMYVLNDSTMRATNRFHNATWPGMPKSKRAQWHAAVYDTALVRVAAFPGVLAFKRGGWQKSWKDVGVRVSEIGKRVVALRWGTERPWPKPDKGWEEWMDVWGE